MKHRLHVCNVEGIVHFPFASLEELLAERILLLAIGDLVVVVKGGLERVLRYAHVLRKVSATLELLHELAAEADDEKAQPAAWVGCARQKGHQDQQDTH